MVLHVIERKKNARIVYLLADEMGNWALFMERRSAEKAKRALENEEAQWCEGCGNWVIYQGTMEFHRYCPIGENFWIKA